MWNSLKCPKMNRLNFRRSQVFLLVPKKKLCKWERCNRVIATGTAIFGAKFPVFLPFYTLYIERKCKNNTFSYRDSVSGGNAGTLGTRA